MKKYYASKAKLFVMFLGVTLIVFSPDSINSGSFISNIVVLYAAAGFIAYSFLKDPLIRLSENDIFFDELEIGLVERERNNGGRLIRIKKTPLLPIRLEFEYLRDNTTTREIFSMGNTLVLAKYSDVREIINILEGIKNNETSRVVNG